MLVQTELRNLASKRVARVSLRFFKTGKGEYGEGDVFLGIPMPVLRKIAEKYTDLKLAETQKLIRSKYHEERLTGLVILVNKYAKAQKVREKNKIYSTYIKQFKHINNWDLVDVSCPKLIGKHLANRNRQVLYKWAKSKDLWTRRISIVTTWWFIRQGDLNDVFKISKILLDDEQDLIHKAVGWMLREAWKQDSKRTEIFLKKHYSKMPRTMLRYAIEKIPETRRKKYLAGNI